MGRQDSDSLSSIHSFWIFYSTGLSVSSLPAPRLWLQWDSVWILPQVCPFTSGSRSRAGGWFEVQQACCCYSPCWLPCSLMCCRTKFCCPCIFPFQPAGCWPVSGLLDCYRAAAVSLDIVLQCLPPGLISSWICRWLVDWPVIAQYSPWFRLLWHKFSLQHKKIYEERNTLMGSKSMHWSYYIN